MLLPHWPKYKIIPDCPYCADNTHVRKHGVARSKIQRYRCTGCNRTFQGKYIYQPRPERLMETC